ncbi:MAG: hypothetical protein HY791_03600 [Deltaproteobacteria bacterium]|nr:hypothetical protein [Deltaproteobacteria bacterium]
MAQYNLAVCPGGVPCLNKLAQVKAILTGCNSATDGVLDRWWNDINFQIRYYGGTTSAVTAGWTATQALADTNVRLLTSSGSTPIVQALRDSGVNYQTTWKTTAPANTKVCRKKFAILMTDGLPNGNSVSYNYACTPPPANPMANQTIAQNRPDLSARYNYQNHIMCNVTGKPGVGLYDIGVGKAGTDYNPVLMQTIANEGGGQFFPAGNESQLNAAFEGILASIQSKSAVFFSAPGQAQAGLFTGDRVFISAFAPVGKGRWIGNLKSHCVFPPVLPNGQYNTTVTTCMFKSTTGLNLLTNPSATDTWTGSTTTATDIGGAGLKRKNSLGLTMGGPYYGTDAACTGACKKPKIYSWRAGTAAYVPVKPSTWNSDDSWVSGGAAAAFINYLHGYQRVQFDKNPYGGAPIADLTADGTPETLMVDTWALGDPMHAPTIVVQYDRETLKNGIDDDSDGRTDEDCDNTAGICYIFMAANDGMLHVFDAFDGTETSALVPSELWDPNDAIRYRLPQIDQQPTIDHSHKYFVDGALTLVHNDANGNVYVDPNAITNPNEKARLFFSLGRGGRAMYMMDLNQFNGVFSTANNPIYPVYFDSTVTNAWSELQHVLSNPFAGEMLFDGPDADSNPEPHVILAMGSGHVPDFDYPDLSVPRNAPGPIVVKASQPISASGPAAKTCVESIGSTSGGAIHCSTSNTGSFANPSGNYDTGATGTSKILGPYKVPGAVALRYCFSALELETGSAGNAEYLNVRNGNNGVLAGRIEGALGGVQASPGDGGKKASDTWWAQDPSGTPTNRCTQWVYDDAITLELIIDNKGDDDSLVVVSRLEYLYLDQPVPTVAQRPTVYVVDPDSFNSSTAGVLKPFTNAPGDAGVIKRFTKACVPASANCMDATTDPSLAHMVCPIAGPVSAYSVGRFVRSLYWFDTCGQIFVATQTSPATNTWDVRRLLTANHRAGGAPADLATPLNLTTGTVVAKLLRKGFTRLDLTPATCSGARSVGVYFGTGNGQRLRSVEELDGSTINSQRDVIGAIFDDGVIEDKTMDGDLQNITTIASSNFSSVGKKGWYIELEQDEKASRDPLVFLGIAYYKTHKTASYLDQSDPALPVIIPAVSDSAIECTAPNGLDRAYAMNACNGKAVVDGGDGSYDPGDRQVFSESGEGGSGITLFSPQVGETFASGGSMTSVKNAKLVDAPNLGNLPVLMWREPRIK